MFREDQEVLLPETSDPVGFGHGKAYQLPKSPGDGISAAFEITVPEDGNAHDSRARVRHRRLFCYDDLHG